MNERIRELTEQAGAVTFGDKICLFGDQDIEKFAELIVRECASIAGMNDDDTLSEGDIRARSIKRQIREHLGVKE